jgi:transposase
VRTRTRYIALLKALVRRDGLRLPSSDAEHVPVRLQALALSPMLAAEVAPLVTTLALLNQEITAADVRIVAIRLGDPVVARLATAPGIGSLTATAFVATVDEVSRFASAHQLEAYLGLVPSERSSGERQRRGAITKAGNARMRWLLIEAAWRILRSRRSETEALRAWALQLALRRGKRVAVVALARRLAGILYAMWRDETAYEVRRSRRPTTAAAARAG